MNSKLADALLLLTGVIWGTGFIGTQYAIATGASTSLILTMRFLFAAIFIFILFRKDIMKMDKATFKVGLSAGIFLFFGFFLQTYGQSYTSVSNSSFLTSTNVIMVPFFVWIATKHPPKKKFFALVFLSFLGITVLTSDFSNISISVNYGDIFILLSAVMYALHITYLGIKAKDFNAKQLTFLQLFTIGFIALCYMLVFEPQSINTEIIKDAFLPTLYLAIFSSSICYLLQTTAQQYTSPSKAGLFLSTEGFFGSLFAVILGIDNLTINLVIGGIIIMASVALAEVDFKKRKGNKNAI